MDDTIMSALVVIGLVVAMFFTGFFIGNKVGRVDATDMMKREAVTNCSARYSVADDGAPEFLWLGCN